MPDFSDREIAPSAQACDLMYASERTDPAFSRIVNRAASGGCHDARANYARQVHEKRHAPASGRAPGGVYGIMASYHAPIPSAQLLAGFMADRHHAGRLHPGLVCDVSQPACVLVADRSAGGTGRRPARPDLYHIS